jgi:hypothetical protein
MAIGKSDEKRCRNIVIGNIEACESLSRKDILLTYRRLRLTEATSGYDKVDVLNYLETLNNYVSLPCMEIGDDDLIAIDRDIEQDLLENHCANGQ